MATVTIATIAPARYCGRLAAGCLSATESDGCRTPDDAMSDISAHESKDSHFAATFGRLRTAARKMGRFFCAPCTPESFRFSLWIYVGDSKSGSITTAYRIADEFPDSRRSQIAVTFKSHSWYPWPSDHLQGLLHNFQVTFTSLSTVKNRYTSFLGDRFRMVSDLRDLQITFMISVTYRCPARSSWPSDHLEGLCDLQVTSTVSVDELRPM